MSVAEDCTLMSRRQAPTGGQFQLWFAPKPLWQHSCGSPQHRCGKFRLSPDR